MDFVKKMESKITIQNNYVQHNESRGVISRNLVFAVLLLILTVAFYMVAVIDGAVFGTPEGEIDSIIQEKMKTIL